MKTFFPPPLYDRSDALRTKNHAVIAKVAAPVGAPAACVGRRIEENVS